MARCQMCNKLTANRRSKRYGNLRLCDGCRCAAEESRLRNAELEAQKGNPNFQKQK